VCLYIDLLDGGGTACVLLARDVGPGIADEKDEEYDTGQTTWYMSATITKTSRALARLALQLVACH
jgi:hypothetical protein